ncbi:uncharacterized protein LOC126366293 [Pectinophora gossypiella]|nr:uncharacterized protein LOC126366293 [Pectinophora gossypiella]
MIALFACKCLNLTLESDKIEDNIDIGKLELTPTEQRDIFFSEKLVSCPSGGLKHHAAQPALLGQRPVGRWLINSCIACGQTTHAVLTDRPNIVLICKSINTTLERVNSLKKSKNFSPVFHLLVPEVSRDIEMKENVDTSNLIFSDRKSWPPQQVLGTLSKQLNQTLQAQLEAMEESVRQFRDQKYAEFEAFRERAHRDHKILTSIISKARKSSESEGWRIDAGLDNGPPSPQLPPLQRRRLSSFKDAKKLSQVAKPKKQLPPEEDSLEAEDIFDLEGTDSRHNMVSDQDDYDSDPEGSRDEGIHIGRGRAAAADIARSLPINMPNFPTERAVPSDLDDDEEPQDIAASIKALARSVHGDPFELPRPRFSTQI